jgi:major membrane immunogen (membrane-anchored lipoprotein)
MDHMKKIVSILVGGLMAAALFAGCGSSAAYKDGTYKASYKDFDDHGWKSQVEVTVKDGKISDAKFDCVNADGKLKSQDADYNSSMKKVSKAF